jgi:hypothetical protein
MELSLDWDSEFLLNSPLFTPLQPVIKRLDIDEFPQLKDWNSLLSGVYQGISVQNGLPLRFVAQERGKLGFESQYEPRCYLSGEVQTRAINWHDCFNALVWLSFPKSKAAINARHYQALKEMDKKIAGEITSQRGKVRDMSTLLDESGVIVASANSELSGLISSFKWKELFWQNRSQFGTELDFYLFGHGLYEKALQPYIGMTGQGLIVNVEKAFFKLPLTERLAQLDLCVADYLDNPVHCRSTRELHPVPLLGVPGWFEDNENESFYENTAYFRSGRQKIV